MKERLLIIDDDAVFIKVLKKYLSDTYDIVCFSDPEDALAYIRENVIDVVLTDIYMPKITGMEILKAVRTDSFDTDVIMMTAHAAVETAVEAMKQGACDYIIKPFDPEELSLVLRNVFEKRRLLEENLNLKKFMDTAYRPENIIGESEEIKDIFREIEKMSKIDATVLITGESGTGKELVARAVHFSSPRKDKKFLSINCTAIPATLLESELFGYARGAFTGATRDREGLFEYADGGTIFLDEIADADPSIQAKLLRVLDDHKVRPVGSNKEITVDVRVVCATNRELKEAVRKGEFREDLYYRINILRIHLPPLRERRSDIPLLIAHFLKGRKKIHPKAVDFLMRHEWPGNVRELKNIIERTVALSHESTITIDDLPDEVLRIPELKGSDGRSYNEEKKRIIDEFNLTITTRALLKHQGNVTRAAGELGLDRANLQRLMRRYNISSKDFKGKN